MFIFVSLIALLIVGGIFIWTRKRTKKPDLTFTDDTGQKYFVSTAGQSAKRVADLGLDEKSPHASNLLDEKKLNLRNEAQEKINYEPNSIVDWIVDVDCYGATIPKDILWKAFQDREWADKYPGVTLYGLSHEDNQWTYVVAADVPDQFHQLKFGCRYLAMFGDTLAISKERISDYLAAIENRFKKFNIPVKVTPRIPVSEAVERAKHVIRIAEELNVDALIMLRSEGKPFNLKKCWQVLTNLGLQWGDGDLFHWNNTRSGDVFFSVWTSTSPGYFVPEMVAKNQYTIEDLVFGFSIPRQDDPVNVLLVMLDCIRYCQKELGGYMLNRYGKLTQVDDLKAYVSQTVAALDANGFRPGSEPALMTF